ncbi:MAG: shikimate kinase [Tannerella sp.]|jgi:shikimate kinase|nr:shikimate kinase [Tannerella sp.]
MQRIFLTGYMGAGKTTTGKRLSEQLGLSFIDLDHFIEKRYYKSVRQIFEEKGEDGFRELERKHLREVGGFENVVISTGGGTPCFHENMDFMNQSGTTVYLKVPVDELAKRLEQGKNIRPVLKGRTGEELKRFIEESLSKRSRNYEQAQIIFDATAAGSKTNMTALIRQIENASGDL